MIWSEYTEVNSHDCDKNGIARPTGVFRILQEAAAMHLSSMGQGEADMRHNGRAYIVSHIGIDVKSPLYMGEKICVRTWESGSLGAKFNRFYSVLRGGEEIVYGFCVCALVDINTGRLIRVGESGYASYTSCERREPTLESRYALGKALSYESAGEFPVIYPFIDRNGHMNNTCYADMFFSAVPNATEKYMSAISISYLRQAKLGDVLSLEVASEGDVYYIKSILPDGAVNSTAAIKAKAV